LPESVEPAVAPACYLRFPGHPSEKYADMWEFLLRELGAGAKAEAIPGR
jgi:hypothetical protein